ncbi:MAG: hypothetical protein Edafosvirus3_45 [Edafosvirus sp.]|uniref:Uncharacterized protein n=1 Tax=Edafosvirus sp. TaxID=2487765 RepID=A0A3G4ZSV6_9VIRU|nr:MAG: hypothetical protein Edafosvirus3_45 [Edafosvirus sp.]
MSTQPIRSSRSGMSGVQSYGALNRARSQTPASISNTNTPFRPANRPSQSQINTIKSFFTRPKDRVHTVSNLPRSSMNRGFNVADRNKLRSFVDFRSMFYRKNKNLSHYIYIYNGVLPFAYYTGTTVCDIAWEYDIPICDLLYSTGEIDYDAYCNYNCDNMYFDAPINDLYTGPGGLVYITSGNSQPYASYSWPNYSYVY